MATVVRMPQLAAGGEEAAIQSWLVAPGDPVTTGQAIVEIETEKAVVEYEVDADGIFAGHLVAAGDAVAVGSPIAVIATPGESLDAALAAAGVSTSPSAPAPGPEPTAAPASASAPEPAATPAPIAVPERAPLAGSEPGTSATTERLFVSPLVRRLAAAEGVDLGAIQGSGPRGRIVRRDLEDYLVSAAPGAAPAAPPPAPASPTAAPVTAPQPDAAAPSVATGYTDIPHTGMRRAIARRLTESHQTVPSYFVSMDCELDALLKLREEINRAAPMKKTDKGDAPVYKLSVNDFIIKALALALRDVPTANASWTSTARLIHKHSDVGVAVAIPDGLITPIIRKAETKTLSVISNEMKDLARRARDKKLKPEEYQGGTTAVSNLGMFGVSNFTSIINPPHASIVSIGAGVEKPVVQGGEIKVATIMTATFAFDHRVIDGALGAELGSAFRKHIENPMGMLV